MVDTRQDERWAQLSGLEQVEAEFDAIYRRATASLHLSAGGMVGQMAERHRPVVGYGRRIT